MAVLRPIKSCFSYKARNYRRYLRWVSFEVATYYRSYEIRFLLKSSLPFERDSTKSAEAVAEDDDTVVVEDATVGNHTRNAKGIII